MSTLLIIIGQKKGIKDNKFHLVGISNGGMSAFRVAPKIEDHLKSITVLAGYTDSLEELKKIKTIPINLFVGKKDLSWLRPMEKMKKELHKLNAKITWQVMKNEGHELKSLFNSPKIFDIISIIYNNLNKNKSKTYYNEKFKINNNNNYNTTYNI